MVADAFVLRNSFVDFDPFFILPQIESYHHAQSRAGCGGFNPFFDRLIIGKHHRDGGPARSWPGEHGKTTDAQSDSIWRHTEDNERLTRIPRFAQKALRDSL